MKKYILLAGALLCLTLPSIGLAEEQFGIGGSDYMVDRKSPDLLDDNHDTDEPKEYVGIYDPLEPLNRVFFVFNDKLYFWVLKPVKTGYTAVVPWDFRFIIGNFFNNLASPVDFVNTLLQGRFNDAGAVLSRFVINSTIGVFGFGDAAAEAFDIQPRNGDFGETLGVYGIGEGVFLNWPFFGPSNIRDSVGFVADMQLHPYNYLDLDSEEIIAARSLEFINRLSLKGDSYEELKRISIDPYVATRQAYTDYRRSLIKSHKLVDKK
ncbi:MlaA family lipoprotein [Desulfopila aestuarii]|uniref:MlaA family lipoprotein n=1 Tax=Desulfopila aestuarii TaxID=231440 RepID=UPI001F2FD5DB|nr:VacJ family lipoprotein [Desulfopila aestuarii]